MGFEVASDDTGATTRRATDDAGFTLVEVLVAVMVISVVMLGLGAVFVATASGTDAQGLKQTAVRVATGGLDRVHAVPGPALAGGRKAAAVQQQWDARPAGVRTLLGSLPAAVDPTSSTTLTLPLTPETVVVDGLTYSRSYYVATCQLTAAATCLATAASGTVPMYEVVVGVTWRHESCPASACAYQLSTLVDAGTVDPVFDTTEKAAAPVIAGVADVVQDVGEGVTGPTFTVSGGSGTRSYTADVLPSGVTLTSSGALTGTLAAPTAATGTKITITVSDEFGQSSSTTFTWTVNPLPTLTAAAVPVTAGTALSPVTLATTLGLTGGTAGYTWTCGTLPAGVSLTNGVLTGTLATAGSYPLSCTVTDARGKTARATVTLTVLPKLLVTNPVTGSTAVVSRLTGVAFTATATGCSGTCTWQPATGLPPGVTFNATTGAVSGKPTTPDVFKPVFTVKDTAGRTVTSTVTWTVL